MKITDRLDKLEGVEKTYWDFENSRLTIYYDDSFSSDKIGICAAKVISDNQLQDSIKEFRLISYSKEE